MRTWRRVGPRDELERAVLEHIRASRLAGGGRHGPQRSDDRINEEVCRRLTESPAIDAGEIEVTVDNGAVKLSGTVREPEDKRLSEELVEQTPGVREIHNQLRVRKQE